MFPTWFVSSAIVHRTLSGGQECAGADSRPRLLSSAVEMDCTQGPEPCAALCHPDRAPGTVTSRGTSTWEIYLVFRPDINGSIQEVSFGSAFFVRFTHVAECSYILFTFILVQYPSERLCHNLSIYCQWAFRLVLVWGCYKV